MKNLGSPKICMACMTTIEIGQNYVEHHVTYFPETIVNVHTRCHGFIHRSDKYPNLVPDFRESLRWARKRKQMYWTWQPYAHDYYWLNFMNSIDNGFMTPERIENIRIQQSIKYWDDVKKIREAQQKLNIKQDWCSSDQIPS